MPKTSEDDFDLRSYADKGDVRNLKRMLKKGTCSDIAKLYTMFSGILYCYPDIVIAMLEAGVTPTSAPDDPILRVLKLCKDPKITVLFEKYTK